MYLYSCFFLHLCYCISSIKYRKGGCVINPLKIECSFNNKGFYVMPLNSHCTTSAVKQLNFVFEMFIDEVKKDVVGRTCIYKKTQVL